MKAKLFIAMLVVVMLGSFSTVGAQVIINNLAQWNAALANQPWQPDVNPNMPDYIINADPNNQYVVANALNVLPGTDIAMGQGAKIIIEGTLTVGNQGNPALSRIRSNGGVWNTICLRGNGGAAPGTANIFNTEISGGGDDAGDGGMITMTNQEQVNTSPTLLLWHSFLRGSESDGIYVYDVDPEDGNFRVSSSITLQNGSTIGDAALPIFGHGIHYQADVDQAVPNVFFTTTTLIIENSFISNNGLSGVYHEECRAVGGMDQVGLTVTIHGSEICENGHDGVNIVCPDIPREEMQNDVTIGVIDLEASLFNDNGANGGEEEIDQGWGFRLKELPEFALGGMQTSNIHITDECEFSNNTKGGLCLYHVDASPVFIDHCFAVANGSVVPDGNNGGPVIDPIPPENFGQDNANHPNVYQRGMGILLYPRSASCGQIAFAVTNCEILNNQLMGLHIRYWRGHSEGSNWFIQGNQIRDNGQGIEWGGVNDDNDFAEGANIHAYTCIDNLVLTNNEIGGAYVGIYLEHIFRIADQENDDSDRMPRQLSVYNNFQYGTAIGGDWTLYGLAIDKMGDEDGQNLDAIYNNLLLDNSDCGVLLGTPGDPNVQFDNLEDDELCNNAIGNTDADNNFGVSYEGNNEGPDYLNNGFFNIQAGNEYVNCDGQNTVTDNPQFTDLANKEFNLFWESPYINAGYRGAEDPWNDLRNRSTADAAMSIELEGNEVNRDGSRNDIGLYGGHFANGIIGLAPGTDYYAETDESDFDFDPYCSIAAGHNSLDNDLRPQNHAWCPGDYYRVFTSIYTHNGDVIDICDPNEAEDNHSAYFEFTGNYRWYMQGTIHANGNDGAEEPRTIYFRPAAGVARWMRLEINIPDDDCNLDGCDMAGGGYSVYAYGGAELDVPDLNINNCRFADSEYQNVLVSGDIPVHFVNCDFTGAQWDGLTISNNEDRSTVQTCNFSDNGSADTYYAGLRFSSSSPIGDAIASNTIGLNTNRGVYCFGSSPDIGGAGVDANVIYNNGPDQGQGGLIGAELYMTTGSEPIITRTNIWDADGGGNRRGVFAYKSGDEAPATVNCYWGGDDIWDNEIADFDGLDAAVKATFFNNVPVPAPAATSDDFIQGGAPVPPDIDSEGDFETAIELMASGEYGRAVRYFWSHLNDHSGICDFNSLQRLLICVRRSGGDLRELRSSYLEYARDEQTLRQVSFEARRLAGMALLYAGDPRAAIEALGDLAANAHSPSDSIAALMDIAWAELVGRGGPGNDALFDYDARINDLSRLYEEAVEKHTASKTLLPTQLTLEPAWPNPFNGSTRINFSLPEAAEVSLQIVNIQGRSIQSLLSGKVKAGRHSVVWNASEIAAGVYFCKLSVAGSSVTTKLILAK